LPETNTLTHFDKGKRFYNPDSRIQMMTLINTIIITIIMKKKKKIKSGLILNSKIFFSS